MTPAHLTALKADIAANANTIDFGGQTQIKNLPNTPDANNEIAAQWYNKFPVVDFFGNYRNVPAADVFNSVAWKKYTMNDMPPVATVPASPTVVETYALNLHMARATFAGQFQMNLQTMLIGRESIDATKANTVQGLKDATDTNMPTGAAGANAKGGWNAIQVILCRKGLNIEKLLANTAGGNGAATTTAATFDFDGQITGADVTAARNS